MKVGTDGVLLGAWAAVQPQDRRMLDIGTGTGLIALMLAQRAPEAHVTGVDIDDVGQARENAAASPWSGRVAFAQCPVQEFETPEPFDLIVSNPPFFVDSLTCPDRGRTAARHAVHLPFGDLRDAVLRLLAPGGRFAVILPTAEAERFLAVCAGRLALVRRTDVRTTPRRPAKRALMEFVRADRPADRSTDCSAAAPEVSARSNHRRQTSGRSSARSPSSTRISSFGVGSVAASPGVAGVPQAVSRSSRDRSSADSFFMAASSKMRFRGDPYFISSATRSVYSLGSSSGRPAMRSA